MQRIYYSKHRHSLGKNYTVTDRMSLSYHFGSIISMRQKSLQVSLSYRWYWVYKKFAHLVESNPNSRYLVNFRLCKAKIYRQAYIRIVSNRDKYYQIYYIAYLVCIYGYNLHRDQLYYMTNSVHNTPLK